MEICVVEMVLPDVIEAARQKLEWGEDDQIELLALPYGSTPPEGFTDCSETIMPTLYE